MAARAGILLVRLRREQGRSAEAEAMARDLRARQPAFIGARVELACLLGDLGRDSEARAELVPLAADEFASVRADPGRLPALCQLAELCALVDMDRGAAFLYRKLAPHASRLAVEPTGAACYGSVSHALGVLAHAVGHWEEAAGHFEQALVDHQRAGAPVLAAHTRRQYAALLRARGEGDDWERSIELLSDAETIYRRLGIEGLATEARTVLARSQDLAVPPIEGPCLWRREGDQWAIGSADRVVRLPHAAGISDVACLVAQPGRSFHVVELWTGSTNSPPVATPVAVTLDGRTRAECRARIEELDGELARGRDRHDAVLLSLARAERDIVAGELAAEPVDDDPVGRMHRLVTLRLRLALDHVAEVHPELGRHLRQSVRTGTFCAYEPPFPVSWTT